MKTVSGSVCSAGISCLTVLILRLLLPGRGGFSSLFGTEQENETGPVLGGIFLLPGLIAGMLAGGGSITGNALFALLITAASILIGFIDDLISLQDKRGEGIVPWLKVLLVFALMLSAAAYLSFSDVPGRTQFLPVCYACADMRGWYMLLSFPLLIGRVSSEKMLAESTDLSFSDNGIEAIFWCFVFCLAGETGAMQWAGYRSEFSGMAVFAGAFAGALLGICLFNPGGKALSPGMSGYFGIACAMSLTALCSGWLILLPLAALWPFLSGVYALIHWIRGKKSSEKDVNFLLADYFTAHGMSMEQLQRTVRWISLLGALLAAVLYVI